MISSATQADAAVAGFLARLIEQAPAPARSLPARVLILADDIAARHTACAHARSALLRPAAVVVAAYRILSGALPARDLTALLHDCWAYARHCSEADCDPLALDGSRWNELGAMLFSVAGLPGLYPWLRERFGSGARGAALEQAFWREFCADEAVPELAGMFHDQVS